MLSKNLEETLHRAFIIANEKHHEYATLEHLLFALISDPDAVAVLRSCGIDVEELSNTLLQYIEMISPALSIAQ